MNKCQFCDREADHIKGKVRVCSRCSNLVEQARDNTLTKNTTDELGTRWFPGFEDLSK